MELLITILAFIVIFGLLIFVHELGHFLVARRNGIKVEEFGFGLPLLPRIFAVKQGETTYSVYPVPIGGFVKMLGEDDGSKSSRSFASKSTGVRARVLVAGVAMNALLAFVLLAIGFAFKMQPIALCASDIPNAQFQNTVSIAAVGKDSPAERSGLKTNDQVKRIGNRAIDCNLQVPRELRKSPGQPVSLEIVRDGQVQNVTVTPGEKGKAGAGRIGIAPKDNFTELSYPLWEAPVIAAAETVAITKATVIAIGDVFANLVTSGRVPEGVAGPVGIAKLTGDVINLGALVVLRFVAIISLSLAIFNLLPIPALDGGRLLFVGVEKIRGRPISAKTEQAIHAAGFFLLIGLILVITYFDVTR